MITTDNLQTAKELLTKKFGDNTFRYKQALEVFKAGKLDISYLYHFAKAGCLTKQKWGTYKINETINRLTPKEIYAISTTKSRTPVIDHKLLRDVKTRVTRTPLVDTEEYAIKTLKALGYKVLKPVNEYREV